MPASTEVAYGRLLKPFSLRRLADALYHVQADGHAIEKRLMGLMIDPPGTPERWRFELDQIVIDLWSLKGRCEAAQETVEAISEDADRDFGVAVNAMQAALRGMRDGA